MEFYLQIPGKEDLLKCYFFSANLLLNFLFSLSCSYISVHLPLPLNLTIFLVLVDWLYFSNRKNAEEGGQDIFITISSDFMCLLEAWMQLMKNPF